MMLNFGRKAQIWLNLLAKLIKFHDGSQFSMTFCQFLMLHDLFMRGAQKYNRGYREYRATGISESCHPIHTLSPYS